MQHLALLSVLFATASALATGFAIHDLTKAPFNAEATLGKGYIARAEPERMTIMCGECDGSPMVDVLLGKQDDGTEKRFREGSTTVGQLETTCKQREPSCRIEALKILPAVGWMSSYRSGAQFGHTAVVFRDGDRLTIRTLATDSKSARTVADALAKTLIPMVVGK